MKNMKIIIVSTFLLLPVIAAPRSAMADDVTDQINEAMNAYKKGDLNTTLTALNSAAQFVRQAKADALIKLLPEPISGWKLKDKKASSVGPTMFGRGIVVGKTYTKERARVEISLTTDSPLLSSMAMMFSNPAMMGGNSRLVVINGEKFLHDERKNQYQSLIANKILLSIKGNSKTDDADVKSYLKQLDIKAIKKSVE